MQLDVKFWFRGQQMFIWWKINFLIITIPEDFRACRYAHSKEHTELVTMDSHQGWVFTS